MSPGTSGLPNDDADVLVFVYGSLRPSHHNAHVLEDAPTATHLGLGTTRDAFFMYGYRGGQFPYLLMESIGGSGTPVRVRGNLWKVGPDVLRTLDYIEGHPEHYTRMTVPIVLENVDPGVAFKAGAVADAFVYIMRQPHVIAAMRSAYPRSFTEVPGGDWTHWMETEMVKVWRMAPRRRYG